MNPRLRYMTKPTARTPHQLRGDMVDALSGKKPMDGREMRAIEYLAVMDSKITSTGDALRERLKNVPHGWRQWRLMATTANRLLSQLYDTMTQKNLQRMHQLVTHGEIVVRMKQAVNVPEHTLISEEDLREVVNAALDGTCTLCVKDGKEIQRCPLRRAMYNIAPPMEEGPYTCGYADVVTTMPTDNK